MMSKALRVEYRGAWPPIAVHHDFGDAKGWRAHKGGCGPQNPVCVALYTPGGAPLCPKCAEGAPCAEARALMYE